ASLLIPLRHEHRCTSSFISPQHPHGTHRRSPAAIALATLPRRSLPVLLHADQNRPLPLRSCVPNMLVTLRLYTQDADALVAVQRQGQRGEVYGSTSLRCPLRRHSLPLITPLSTPCRAGPGSLAPVVVDSEATLVGHTRRQLHQGLP